MDVKKQGKGGQNTDAIQSSDGFEANIPQSWSTFWMKDYIVQVEEHDPLRKFLLFAKANSKPT